MGYLSYSVSCQSKTSQLYNIINTTLSPRRATVLFRQEAFLNSTPSGLQVNFPGIGTTTLCSDCIILEYKPPEGKDGVQFKKPSDCIDLLENKERMKASASAKISGSGKGYNIGWYSAEERKGRFQEMRLQLLSKDQKA